MINLIMRLMGLGKAVDALDGETSKAYIGAVATILTGAASLLGGVANIVAEILPLHGGAAYFEFARNLSHDSNAALILAGAAAIGKGLADIGNRHAIAKMAAQPAPAVPPDLLH